MTGDADLNETGFWINTLLLQSPPMYTPQTKEGEGGRGEGEGGERKGEGWPAEPVRRGSERFIVCDVGCMVGMLERTGFLGCRTLTVLAVHNWFRR